jgi:16S rRNA (guanine966-N2)-methyltransferase
MFSMIGPVDGTRVIDLYAGSGALAIEALSRGAVAAVLVERARAALVALRQNLAALGLDSQATILAADVERSRSAIVSHGPYDLLLVDPPYEEVTTGRATRMVSELIAAGAAAAGAIIVLEHGSSDSPPEISGAALDRSRRYGDTVVSLYRVV